MFAEPKPKQLRVLALGLAGSETGRNAHQLPVERRRMLNARKTLGDAQIPWLQATQRPPKEDWYGRTCRSLFFNGTFAADDHLYSIKSVKDAVGKELSDRREMKPWSKDGCTTNEYGDLKRKKGGEIGRETGQRRGGGDSDSSHGES